MRTSWATIAAFPIILLLATGGARAEPTVIEDGFVRWELPGGWEDMKKRPINPGEMYISLRKERSFVFAGLYGVHNYLEKLPSWLDGTFFDARMKHYSGELRVKKKHRKEYKVPIASGQDTIVVEYQLELDGAPRRVALVGLRHGSMLIGIFVGTTDWRAEVGGHVKGLLAGLSIGP